MIVWTPKIYAGSLLDHGLKWGTPKALKGYLCFCFSSVCPQATVRNFVFYCFRAYFGVFWILCLSAGYRSQLLTQKRIFFCVENMIFMTTISRKIFLVVFFEILIYDSFRNIFFAFWGICTRTSCLLTR